VHLVSDYIHPTPRGGRCRIPVYLPEEERDVPVVICSELPSNEGSSVTHSAYQIAAEVIRYHKLGVQPVWIEHYPKRGHRWCLRDLRTGCVFELRVKGEGTLPGETRLTIGEPTWKSLDRKAVEALVEQEV
jgi:hypothetical protein